MTNDDVIRGLKAENERLIQEAHALLSKALYETVARQAAIFSMEAGGKYIAIAQNTETIMVLEQVRPDAQA